MYTLIKNSLIVFITVAISLTIIEIGFRVFYPQELDTGIWRYPAPHGQEYLVNIPNINKLHKFGKNKTVYQLNEQGLRNGPLIDGAKKILALGDSFTFGLFIDAEKTAIGRLQEHADENKIQFLNAAIAGSGIAEFNAYLEDYGHFLKPSVVVVFINYTSFSRGFGHPLYSLDTKKKELVRNTPVHINSINNPDYVPPQKFRYSWMKGFLYKHSHLVNFLRKTAKQIKIKYLAPATTPQQVESKLQENYQKQPSSPFYWLNVELPFYINNPPIDLIEKFTEASLKKLKKTAEFMNAELVIVNTGFDYQAFGIDYSNTSNKKTSIDYYALIKLPEFCKKYGITYIDLTPDIHQALKNNQQITIEGDGHPNELGYQIIADSAWKRGLSNIIKPLH